MQLLLLLVDPPHHVPLRAREAVDRPPEQAAKAAHEAALLGPEMRSALAVPLIVADRVLGLLSIQSRRDAAYDDHQLSVLATIGQQAAVAIENARHHHKATVDSLTGFFHKDFFFTRLHEEDSRVRRYGGKFALLMVDLDGFKQVNDTHGHLVGDRFLAEITDTIRKQLRGSDLASRYGGDEFAFVLPRTGVDDAKRVAERIRGDVQGHAFKWENRIYKTTASVGVAGYPNMGKEDPQEVVRAADEALYRAKAAGKNRVEVSEKLPEARSLKAGL